MRKRKISDKAIDYILSRNVDQLRNLKVGKIARTIGANSSYLSRRFKIDQQMSLHDFILREKIFRAIFILEENPGASIRGISKELGFPDFSDFALEFKKNLAIDPERYQYIKKSGYEKQSK